MYLDGTASCVPRSGDRNRLRVALFLLALFVAVALPAVAGAKPPAPYAAMIARWEQTLNAARDAVDNPVLSPEDRLPPLSESLEQILVEARTLQARLEKQRKPLMEQLDSLGPAPGTESIPELEEIAARRAELAAEIAQIEGQERQIAFARVRTLELVEQIGRIQQQHFIERLGQRGPQPTNPAVWLHAARDLGGLTRDILTSPFISAWVDVEATSPRSLFYLFAIAASLLLSWPLRAWLLRRFGPDPTVPDPSYARRILAAVVMGLANVVIPATAIGVFVLTLLAQNWLIMPLSGVIKAIAANLIVFLLIAGMARSTLSPRLPAWRIVRIAPESAIKLSWTVTAIAAIVAVHRAISGIAGQQLGSSPELDSILVFVRTGIIAGLVVSVLPRRHWIGEDKKAEAPIWSLLRIASGALILATPLLALTGFTLLALYIQSRLLFTVFFVGLALLLRVALREMLDQLLSPQKEIFRRVGAPIGFTERTASMTLFWVKLLLDPLITLPLLVLLLYFYGVAPTSLRLWLSYVGDEIRIGGVTISPIDIVLAILVFVAGISAAAALRRWLATKVLPNTRLDYGVRNSIAAGTGYVAIGIAVMLAIATAGVNLSSLAFVAGALSVGIGFGLRTVVENFVAGLLLLIERPVQIGDWIVVGGSEGTVKRISVRSTEIETFDRAVVILPNSELIASAVTNWTYHDRTARIIIKIGVAYGSPTRQVRDLLMACAKGHADILSYPAPQVVFQGFGEWALNFELRCFVGDTDKLGTVRSDICFAIDDAFRANGIEIPFPQRVLHVRPDAPATPGDGSAAAQPAAETSPGGGLRVSPERRE
jgi:small-conductance mechanosensitive channel